jgi:hypothetical protein
MIEAMAVSPESEKECLRDWIVSSLVKRWKLASYSDE